MLSFCTSWTYGYLTAPHSVIRLIYWVCFTHLGLNWVVGICLASDWSRANGLSYPVNYVSHSDWLLSQVGLVVNGYRIDGCFSLHSDWLMLVWSSQVVVL